jgi:hypothetical protein
MENAIRLAEKDYIRLVMWYPIRKSIVLSEFRRKYEKDI